MIKRVSFKSDNLYISAALALPDSAGTKFPGAIIFHGMTSSEKGYTALAEMLARNGIAGLAVTMRGHGDSEGDFTRATVKEAIHDALAAYDFLISQAGVDATRIGVVGSSVGAILSALASKQRDIRSIVFRAPAAYTEQMMQISMADTMTNEGRQFHEINNLADTPAGQAIKEFKGSLLVIASENDATIPSAVTQGYIDLADKAELKELITIDGASHTLTNPSWKKEFRQTTVNWLKQTL